MENKIRIGIVGYGNLGRGVLKSVVKIQICLLRQYSQEEIM